MAVLIVDGGGAAVLRGLRAADSAAWIFWRREGETLGRPAGGAGGGVGKAGAGGSEVKREVRMAESRELRMDILCGCRGGGSCDSWMISGSGV